MINLTILGVVSLVFGLTLFAIAVYQMVKNCGNDDTKFKHYIENLCWGAIVGSILFFSVMCFSISDHKSKNDHQCCEHCEDSTSLNKSE